MVFIWFSYGFHRISRWTFLPTDSPRHATLPEVGENRPMEGRNDLDIDPGCLAFSMGLFKVIFYFPMENPPFGESIVNMFYFLGTP